jgi:hypothetical protein
MSTDSSSAPAAPPQKLKPWQRGTWGAPGGLLVGFAALYGSDYAVTPLVPLIAMLPLSINTKNSILRVIIEALACLVVLLGLKLYGSKLGAIGINKPKLTYVWYAVLGFGAYFLASIVIGIVAKMFLPIDDNQAQQIGYQGLAGFDLALAFATLVVLTPLAEESIFRGFLFTGLRNRMPFWATAFVVSALFGLAHGQWNVGLDVFAMSLVSCYLRERSGSLWPSILLHVLKNALAFYLLYIYNGG